MPGFFRPGWKQNLRFSQILGGSLIVLSWILWGSLLILPFFRLTIKQYAIVYPAILVATNVFWIGVALVGKELLQRYNIPQLLKKWFIRINPFH